MNMEKARLKKFEEICQRIVSEYIINNLKDLNSEYSLVTVTDAKISSDLSYLDIFVSSIKNKEKLTKDLANHRIDIQKIIYKKVNLRKLPILRFRYDEKWEISININNTINSLK